MSVPARRRLGISLGCGFMAGLRAFLIARVDPVPRDIGQVWYAARAVLHGQNPYAVIGPGRAFDWPAPLFYPLPAAFTLTPLAPFSLLWASALFAGIGGACFAWALLEHGYPPLLGFLGAPMVFASEVAQWSPILAGATVLAPLGILYVAKPTIGAAMFAARPTWWSIVGGLVLLALSFALAPRWAHDWRAALVTLNESHPHVFPYVAPVTVRGGFIALLALFRWRRPEARLVVALACVPQTPMLYEAVPLFLVPRTVVEALTLVVTSWVAIALAAAGAVHLWWVCVLLVYGPVTVMVLRRPNEGSWLARR